ncbi:MAG: hypothetical protein K2N78_00400, partial [Oscillospiraceae bacterium]|nr:hypothetical protein [Oscillospiraceae bacterium]
LFSLSMTVMYALLLFLFQMEALAAEFAEYSRWIIAGLLAFGNITFLIFDQALGILNTVFHKKMRPCKD